MSMLKLGLLCLNMSTIVQAAIVIEAVKKMNLAYQLQLMHIAR